MSSDLRGIAARSRPADGFTLVELLVSLAILALTTALLVEGLHGGSRVWERVQARAHAGETVLVAQTRVAGLLENAIALTGYTGSRPFSRFDGEADRITFLADPASDAAASGGVQLIDLALDGEGRLTLAHRPDLAVADAAQGMPVPLIAGVDRLDLAYFGATPPDNERRWRPRWEDQPTLPELIRVHVEFASGDPRRWRDLIVRPAATVDTACVYIPFSSRCQGR